MTGICQDLFAMCPRHFGNARAVRCGGHNGAQAGYARKNQHPSRRSCVDRLLASDMTPGKHAQVQFKVIMATFRRA